MNTIIIIAEVLCVLLSLFGIGLAIFLRYKTLHPEDTFVFSMRVKEETLVFSVEIKEIEQNYSYSNDTFIIDEFPLGKNDMHKNTPHKGKQITHDFGQFEGYYPKNCIA